MVSGWCGLTGVNVIPPVEEGISREPGNVTSRDMEDRPVRERRSSGGGVTCTTVLVCIFSVCFHVYDQQSLNMIFSLSF